jgi:hypothetical protein
VTARPGQVYHPGWLGWLGAFVEDRQRGLDSGVTTVARRHGRASHQIADLAPPSRTLAAIRAMRRVSHVWPIPHAVDDQRQLLVVGVRPGRGERSVAHVSLRVAAREARPLAMRDRTVPGGRSRTSAISA